MRNWESMRTRTMRHFKQLRPASAILDGLITHYDFLAEHSALDGRTPAQAAGIALPFEDGRGDLIRWATAYEAVPRLPRVCTHSLVEAETLTRPSQMS